MVTSNTTVTGTISSSVLNSLLNSSTNNTTATTTLQGLVANLMASNTIQGQLIIAEEIMRTPNAGIAGAIAEKLMSDLQIADATTRSLAVMQDMQALNTAVNTQAHANGILSGLLSSIGL